MKAKIDIDAVVGGVPIHVRAGDVLPQALVDCWLVSNALIRAIKQGIVEDDDEAPAPVVSSSPAPAQPPKKPKPAAAMAVQSRGLSEDFGE